LQVCISKDDLPRPASHALRCFPTHITFGLMYVVRKSNLVLGQSKQFFHHKFVSKDLEWVAQMRIIQCGVEISASVLPQVLVTQRKSKPSMLSTFSVADEAFLCQWIYITFPLYFLLNSFASKTARQLLSLKTFQASDKRQ
jgi:hypothetical protein